MLCWSSGSNPDNQQQSDRKHTDSEPVIHDALLMIGLIREQQSGEDLCRLLHSPFLIHEEDSGSARIELERVIRKRLTARCRVTDLLYLAGETDKPSLPPALSGTWEAPGAAA